MGPGMDAIIVFILLFFIMGLSSIYAQDTTPIQSPSGLENTQNVPSIYGTLSRPLVPINGNSPSEIPGSNLKGDLANGGLKGDGSLKGDSSDGGLKGDDNLKGDSSDGGLKGDLNNGGLSGDLKNK